jgi:hypothetical protein
LGVGIIGSTAKAVVWVALATLALGAFGGYAFAQQPAAPADDKVLSKPELNALVGKIALYPDDLVAIVLPASTYPLQVVEAERFLQERQKDPSLKASDKWDDSVVALLNYPEVVKLMNDDLDWTWKLGDAVINQRGEVLDAIQSFRGQATAAGNLHTDEHQVVQNDDQGEIQIKPADPQIVYVPYYEPQQVVVQQAAPVYYYYPEAYPLYYYPYPYGYSFGAGYFWGVTTAFVIGWHNHYVHVVHCGYPGHPYYGHTYYGGSYPHGGYYVRHDVNAATSHGNYVWEPHYRAGGQPFTRSDGRQLAIAHHDANAAGAPSGYHRVDRGPPSTAGYRAGNPGIVRNDGHGALRTEGGTSPNAHANPGLGGSHSSAEFHGNGQSVAPSGAREGMKQIQPIRNDPPTQAAIRNELREHAPNQSSFNGQSSSPSLRDPTQHGAPQYNAPQFRGTPQYNTPQVRTAPQYNAPQVRTAPQFHGAPQASTPQMHTMPMPSAPATAPRAAIPHEGGASYVYRSPSMPQASMARPSMPQGGAGRAPAGHEGGAAHGAQGHGGGGGHGSR